MNVFVFIGIRVESLGNQVTAPISLILYINQASVVLRRYLVHLHKSYNTFEMHW